MAGMPWSPAGSRIVALGHFQPPEVVTNHDLAELVETSDEWIRTRTGIVTRHRAAADVLVSDLAVAAARHALATGEIEPGAVDLVIVATMTSEERSPNIAGIVSATLGLTTPAVMDLNVACSGFVHALALADQSIRAGSATRALVVGAERFTAFTDYHDRSTCVLTADGAGACVVEASSPAGIGPVAWGSSPKLASAVRLLPPSNLFAQDGRAVYRWALGEGAGHARRALELAGVGIDEIDVLCTHQANLRIIEPLAEQLGLTDRVVVTDVIESGNTSAASIPLGLSKWWHAGKVGPDQTALLFGFGGGFAYASLVARTPATPPIG